VFSLDTPWAIILCKFSDDDSDPYPRQRFEELFTSAGAGKFNMPDFFRDVSHGKLDLSGSEVFGWHTLAKKRAEYVGSGANQQGRMDLITWARQAEPQAANFFSVVVVANVSGTDLFGCPYGVVTTDARVPQGYVAEGTTDLSPSVLGQEMGHAYGLAHSMSEGSTAEYMDPWDVMSTRTGTMAPHPNYTERDARGNVIWVIGPGLNAANMWGRGWLDPSRTWIADLTHWQTSIQLRPLHHRDLPGYLAARVGPYFFEFRVPEGWDASIGSPVVLAHEYWAGASYLLNGMSGNPQLASGDIFRRGDPADQLGPLIDVKVASIDPEDRTATLEVTRRPDRHPRVGPEFVVGRPDSGGGHIVIVGGRPVRVGPRSPLAEIVELTAHVEMSEEIANGPARDLIRRDALAQIRDRADAELRHMDAPQEPAQPPSTLRRSEAE
jgi:hypothetical protein